MNVRSPESFQDLRKIDGKYYDTFRESAEKRGLLHHNSTLVECMTEVILTTESDAFFIDGPGGSRITFLYRALLATVRSKGFIALATTKSGVAASILPGGRTTYSHFKIPINIDEQFSYNINLTETNILFGGKVIVFGGDFRQTLPVVRSEKKEDFISESILTSRIWNQLEKLRLSENMRARNKAKEKE
ncbi:hypothetical protein H5410_022973 [Solanum commersonii]|uniref:ATP-dependent DNA helicase n=1 Tax=Solanum commersonii TaxID=4109 RepID=A0A9J5ZIY8_SOLCO|nr:hypothetical protein H5410_022973 [Solanum commersonii]